MPTYDYKCENEECGFVFEAFDIKYNQSNAPTECPKCKGKISRTYTAGHGGFDIVGYCYENVYGRKNWKKGKSPAEISKVLANEKINPY